MNLWFLDPEILEQIEISKDSSGGFRVQSRQFQKERKANPEEIIRQLVLLQLVCHYHYPKELIVQEYPVRMGISKKRADIVILGKKEEVSAIIEIKQEISKDSIEQLKSYMHATGAEYGGVISIFNRIFLKNCGTGNFFEITDLPFNSNSNSNKFDEKVNSVSTSINFQNLKKINQKKSALTINDVEIIINNKDLLKYENVRKFAIENGLVLPEKIKNDEWVNILSNLFNNIEIKNETFEENSDAYIVNKFIKENCFETDKTIRITIEKSYVIFSQWHKNNYTEQKTLIPTKKFFAKIIRECGYVTKKVGGFIYFFGLHIGNE